MWSHNRLYPGPTQSATKRRHTRMPTFVRQRVSHSGAERFKYHAAAREEAVMASEAPRIREARVGLWRCVCHD